MECIKGTWSVRELKRQDSIPLHFERSGISRKARDVLSEVVQTKSEKSTMTDIIKSPFTFEFFGT
jgi:predicted nuclease of restriction endonuclease-like (RecB) superfamily